MNQLGIYRALCGAGPLTSAELAHKTGLDEPYVRAWLKTMLAAEYLDYNPVAGRFVARAATLAGSRVFATGLRPLSPAGCRPPD